MVDRLYIEVKNPEKILFSGEAISISSVNDRGSFDILPYHANFFSIIREKIVIMDGDNRAVNIEIKENGILRVVENKISVFLGIEAV
ncbi:hypothetical protein M1328_05235 [Patescibacteria group bacterium]|nr:hypothetical protein [Patescibacteria group bacterium]